MFVKFLPSTNVEDEYNLLHLQRWKSLKHNCPKIVLDGSSSTHLLGTKQKDQHLV